MDFEHIILAMGTFASLLAAFAAYKAIGVSQEIATMQNAVAKNVGEMQSAVALQIADMQKTLSQRQLLIPLWDHITGLNSIDPADPRPVEVHQAVNTLELVALCCEGGMVDEKVIKRTFRGPFMKLYEAIGECPHMESLRRSGKDLLHENPAAMKFYEKLRKEHMDRDELEAV